MGRSPGLAVIAVLALAQGVLGVLRALEWFRVGSDLSGRGVLLLPILGLLAFARGGLVALIALLYILFAWGALKRWGWAWWLGLVAALVNGLVVVSLLIEGEPVVRALPWIVVPLVLLCYLLAPAGRRALGR